MNIIMKSNNFYQSLIQSGDYQPAKAVKKGQDSAIQSMMVKIEDKITKLHIGGGEGLGGKKVTFHKCGKEEHVSPKCPGNKTGEGNPRPGKAIKAWQKVAPKDGKSLTKTVDGAVAKWWGKYQKGKGMWHLGDKAHFEAQHKLVK